MRNIERLVNDRGFVKMKRTGPHAKKKLTTIGFPPLFQGPDSLVLVSRLSAIFFPSFSNVLWVDQVCL